MKVLFFFFLAYLLGSLPFGLWAGYWVKGIDIRQHGSGNLGATNVFRVVGKKWGLAVLGMDAFKGYAAVAWPFWAGIPMSESLKMGLGITAILAHVFPVWLKFQGGKGVASSLGVFLGLLPGPALATLAIWAAVFWISRIISLASITAAALFPLSIFLLHAHDASLPYYLWVSFSLLSFILFTHRQNIRRLIAGEEKKLF